MRVFFVLFILAFIQGCGTQHKLNSSEQIGKLNAAYETQCKNAGGVIGPPIEVESYATCALNNKKVDLTSRSFAVGLSRVIAPDEKESSIVNSFNNVCAKYSGNIEQKKLHYFCNGSDSIGNKWLTAFTADHEPNRGRVMVVNLLRIPEGKMNEGSVLPFLWDFVFIPLF